MCELTVPIGIVDAEVNSNGLSERQDMILGMIKDDTSIQVEEIAESFGLSRATILREIQEIKRRVPLSYSKKEKEWNLGK